MNADRQQVSSAPARPGRLRERQDPSRAGLSVVAGGRERAVRAPRTRPVAGRSPIARHASAAGTPAIVRPMGTPAIAPRDAAAPSAVTVRSAARPGIAHRLGALAVRHRSLLPLPFVIAIALVAESPGALAAGGGASLVAAGLALRLAASAAAGRDGRLVTWGAYAWLRHPHELGTILAWTGIALSAGATSELPALVLGLAAVHLIAARKEEQVLAARHGEEFARWRRRTPGWVPRRPVVALARTTHGATALDAERAALAGFTALLLVASLEAMAR